MTFIGPGRTFVESGMTIWATSYGNVKSEPAQEISFLEKRRQVIPRRPLFPGTLFGVLIPINEIIAEIAPVLFKDPFRLRFPALIVNAVVVKRTIQAAPQIGTTGRTRVPPADDPGNLHLFAAPVTNLHDVSAYLCLGKVLPSH